MSILPGKISDFLKIAVAAAGRGDLQTVQAVLAQKPAWIIRIGSHGRTMLWEAAYRGRLAMVDYLLDQGADIHACGCHFTPLLVEISPYCAARYKRHHAVADRLLTRGATTDIYTAAFLGESDAVADYLDREPSLATAKKSTARFQPAHDGLALRRQCRAPPHRLNAVSARGRSAAVQWWANSLRRVARSRRHPQIPARRWGPIRPTPRPLVPASSTPRSSNC